MEKKLRRDFKERQKIKEEAKLLGKEYMDVDEACLLYTSDITKHKNYKLLEDYDKKNLFDIESYMKRKGKAKLNMDTVITRMQ